MKKYPVTYEIDPISRACLQQKCDELRDFQFLLRHSEQLNEKFHGKAEEIADGLQPWIDALALSLG